MRQFYLNFVQILLRKKKRTAKRYFYRLIWIGFVSAFIPIVLAGAVYFQVAAHSASQQIQNNSQSSLSLVQERMERVLQGIELDGLRLAMNPLLRSSLSNPQFDQDVLMHRNILNAIEDEKNGNDLIGDIYYYHTSSQIVLSDTFGFVHGGSFKYNTDIDSALNQKAQAAWVYLPQAAQAGYISYVRKLPSVEPGTSSGLLIIEIKEALIQKYLEDSNTFQGHQSVYVIGPQNQVLLGSDFNLHSTLGLDRVRFETYANETDQGQFFTQDSQGKLYLCTYSRSTLGRTYLSIVPNSIITKQIDGLRFVTLLVCLFFLSIGILLTVFYANRAYHPIDQLLRYGENLSGRQRKVIKGNEIIFIQDCLEQLKEEVHNLGEFIKEVEPTLREQFLQRLLEGEYKVDGSLFKECETHRIQMHQFYVVLVASIGNFTKGKRFLPDDDMVVTFALKNIMHELLQELKLSGYVIHLAPENGIAILQFDLNESHEAMIQTVREYAQAICSAIQKYLYLNLSVGIGMIYHQVSDVPVSYREALLALQYQIYTETDTVFLMEELEGPKKSLLYSYPQQIESTLIDSLRRGETGEAERALQEFTKAILMLGSSRSIYQCFHMLLSAITLSLEKQGINIFDLLEIDLFGQLMKCHSSREICDWFQENVFTIYQTLTGPKNSMRGKLAIRTVYQYIREHINHEISLIQCAELVGMNPSYLSRLFKKEAGISFVEYVAKCKVEEAKRLCLETDCTFNEISEAIGYSERNLNRAFHRYAQMSPGQFRSLHR
ncbi:MAG: transcriptional regulator, AraC family [Bacilli bacterium]|nr:transcriptional regulator, AraC family [Bacilli bacterium]